MIAMYWRGLHLQIVVGLHYVILQTLDDAIQIAYQVEEGERKVHPKKTLSDCSPRVMNRAYGSSISGLKPRL